MINAKSEKTWVVGSALVGVLILAISWFMLISPKRTDAAALERQTTDAQLQNDVQRAKTSKLKKVDMAAIVASLREGRASLPIESELTDFTRQVATTGSATGAAVKSIAIGTPTLYGDAATAAGASASASGNLYYIPITLVIDGTQGSDLAMLKAVQYSGQRRALVTSVALTSQAEAGASGANTSTQMTLQLQIFVAPQSPAGEKLLQQQLATKIGA
jgi:hypothetical protein